METRKIKIASPTHENQAQAKPSLLDRDLSSIFNRSLLSNADKQTFYQKTHTLLGSGVDIIKALELSIISHKKPAKKQLFEDIKKELIKGSTLSDALQKSKAFSAYETISIQVAENTSKLPQIMEELATFFEQKIATKKELITALTYPIIVVVFSIATILFMLFFVVPMFNEIFNRFGGKLPWITDRVVDLASFIKAYGLYLLIASVALLFLVIRIKDHPTFIKYQFAILDKIPVINKLTHITYMSRFSSTLSLLLSSQIPLTDSLAMTQSMFNYPKLKNQLDSIQNNITQGKGLVSELAKHQLYNLDHLAILQVGEEVNKMDVFFAEVAQQLNAELKTKTKFLNTLLEPILILLLGAIVVTILIAMYLPLFNINNAIG